VYKTSYNQMNLLHHAYDAYHLYQILSVASNEGLSISKDRKDGVIENNLNSR